MKQTRIYFYLPFIIKILKEKVGEKTTFINYQQVKLLQFLMMLLISEMMKLNFKRKNKELIIAKRKKLEEK